MTCCSGRIHEETLQDAQLVARYVRMGFSVRKATLYLWGLSQVSYDRLEKNYYRVKARCPEQLKVSEPNR